MEVAGAGIGVLARLHGRRGPHGATADDEAPRPRRGRGRAAAEGDDEDDAGGLEACPGGGEAGLASGTRPPAHQSRPPQPRTGLMSMASRQPLSRTRAALPVPAQPSGAKDVVRSSTHAARGVLVAPCASAVAVRVAVATIRAPACARV